jgi:hypothetical protein
LFSSGIIALVLFAAADKAAFKLIIKAYIYVGQNPVRCAMAT